LIKYDFIAILDAIIEANKTQELKHGTLKDNYILKILHGISESNDGLYNSVIT
jgi:hypothetical protein